MNTVELPPSDEEDIVRTWREMLVHFVQTNRTTVARHALTELFDQRFKPLIAQNGHTPSILNTVPTVPIIVNCCESGAKALDAESRPSLCVSSLYLPCNRFGYWPSLVLDDPSIYEERFNALALLFNIRFSARLAELTETMSDLDHASMLELNFLAEAYAFRGLHEALYKDPSGDFKAVSTQMSDAWEIDCITLPEAEQYVLFFEDVGADPLVDEALSLNRPRTQKELKYRHYLARTCVVREAVKEISCEEEADNFIVELTRSLYETASSQE